jgi:exopolysaccharide biosynthesis polyprenyl glycosylphosphotransferase
MDPGGAEVSQLAHSFIDVRRAPASRGLATRRRWILRRALASADLAGLCLAFASSTLLFADPHPHADHVRPLFEVLLFLCTLPLWVAFANLLGLYERDDARADHSTIDESLAVVALITAGIWVVFLLSWGTRVVAPELDRLVSLWGFALVLVLTFRGIARHVVRRLPVYVQNGLVVGAGHVGQLIARKVQHHPEYGIRLVGFVDENPRSLRADILDLPVLGGSHELPELVAAHRIDRVIVAFSGQPDARTMAIVRSLRDEDVIVDVVPRLYELVGLRGDLHLIEGLPLLTVPPARLSRSALLVKRLVDVVGASLLLLLASPLLLVTAIRIKRQSPGPVLFRQTRLGANMKPFTLLKFRTMNLQTNDEEHREHIRSTMSAAAPVSANGTYKLQREEDVTPLGRRLRETSLDELPQLINVLRGEMSLVGPRPCIPYETEFFEPHHFDRFLVPQGVTGLWQVTARANSTFGEALEMDVAYVRGWSLGLDLRLLFRTPFILLRQRKATA